MAAAKDITGQRFSRLVVLRYAETKKGKQHYECLCDCGTTKVIQGGNFIRGKSRSCGCLTLEINSTRMLTHGMTGSPTYRVWAAMIQRCTNPRQKENWPLYGGRGIKICDRWLHSFDNFLADMGERPNGKTIDRYPNHDGDYEPSNCRWATSKQQSRNLRKNIILEHDGKTMCLTDWAAFLGISKSRIASRYYRGVRPPQLFYAGTFRPGGPRKSPEQKSRPVLRPR